MREGRIFTIHNLPLAANPFAVRDFSPMKTFPERGDVVDIQLR